jgi:hypothetical protein
MHIAFVTIQVYLVFESLSAEIAEKRALACVDTQVSVEFPGIFEVFTTGIANLHVPRIKVQDIWRLKNFKI